MADKSDDKNKLQSNYLPRDGMKGFTVRPYAEVSKYLGKLSAKTTEFVKKLDKEKIEEDKHKD